MEAWRKAGLGLGLELCILTVVEGSAAAFRNLLGAHVGTGWSCPQEQA